MSFSPLELLRRIDRYELADNRMTLYSSGFGLGSVHYWDGSWDNDEDEITYQSREVFENRDGELDLLLPNGMPMCCTKTNTSGSHAASMRALSARIIWFGRKLKRSTTMSPST